MFRQAVMSTATLAFDATLAAANVAAAASMKTAAQINPVPKPTVLQLSRRGYSRSSYFSRQDASYNPGVQHVFVADKCNSNVTLTPSIKPAGTAGYVCIPVIGFPAAVLGPTHRILSQISFRGACRNATAHPRGASCVAQIPRATNPDDTLPRYTLSTSCETNISYGVRNVWRNVGIETVCVRGGGRPRAHLARGSESRSGRHVAVRGTRQLGVFREKQTLTASFVSVRSRQTGHSTDSWSFTAMRTVG